MEVLNNLRLSTKLSFGFGTVLLLMTAVAVVIYVGVTSIVNASHWVNHTYEVIRTAESVEGSMIDMETGQRGFMVTGEDEYLEPYTEGKKRILALVDKGQSLTSDNKEQVLRWEKVKSLSSKWLEEVAEPEIQARRQVKEGDLSIERFNTLSARTVGKEIFDDIRQRLSNLMTQFSAASIANGSDVIKSLMLDLVNMETGQRGFLLSGKESSLEPWLAGQRSLERNLEDAEQLTTNSAVSTNEVQQLKDKIQDWITQSAEPEIEARRDVNRFPLRMSDIKTMMRDGKGKYYMDAIRSVLTDIIVAEEALIKLRANDQASSSRSVIYTTIFGTLIAGLLSLIVAGVLIRDISRPIHQINENLKSVANGNLTQRIPIHSKNELGQLSIFINSFLTQLQQMIKEIINVSGELAASSLQVRGATKTSKQQMDQQMLETTQVATSIHEMAMAIEDVAKNTEMATTSASESRNRANEGSAYVQETLQSIKSLTDDVEDSSKSLELLKGQSENIGTVLDVIKNIAEQTNLLALNAAIEAARAGEQGRGFAVVADEVRTLAKRTQQSTFEIQKIISDLQKGAGEAVTVMMQSREKSLTTRDKAEKTGEFLISIDKAIAKMIDINYQISTATQEQSVVSQDVNRSITNIESISNATLKEATEAEQAGKDVARLSEYLQQLVTKFKV